MKREPGVFAKVQCPSHRKNPLQRSRPRTGTKRASSSRYIGVICRKARGDNASQHRAQQQTANSKTASERRHAKYSRGVPQTEAVWVGTGTLCLYLLGSTINKVGVCCVKRTHHLHAVHAAKASGTLEAILRFELSRAVEIRAKGAGTKGQKGVKRVGGEGDERFQNEIFPQPGARMGKFVATPSTQDSCGAGKHRRSRSVSTRKRVTGRRPR